MGESSAWDSSRWAEVREAFEALPHEHRQRLHDEAALTKTIAAKNRMKARQAAQPVPALPLADRATSCSDILESRDVGPNCVPPCITDWLCADESEPSAAGLLTGAPQPGSTIAAVRSLNADVRWLFVSGNLGASSTGFC